VSKPSSFDKAIARAAAAAFGTPPSVYCYWDDQHKASVDIVSCNDSPSSGVTSYATVGVSQIPLIKDGKDLGFRTELVGACGSQFADFGNCLSTAAFCVINSRWFVAPGVVFPDVISMYRTSGAMKHVLFLPPFLWDERLQTIQVENERVAWLLAIPISENELRLAESKGVPALEDVLEKEEIDIFDLDRASVV
jgi:hypothetical protein